MRAKQVIKACDWNHLWPGFLPFPWLNLVFTSGYSIQPEGIATFDSRSEISQWVRRGRSRNIDCSNTASTGQDSWTGFLSKFYSGRAWAQLDCSINEPSRLRTIHRSSIMAFTSVNIPVNERISLVEQVPDRATTIRTIRSNSKFITSIWNRSTSDLNCKFLDTRRICSRWSRKM